MGDWNIQGIPHKGWECVDVIDLADQFVNEDDIVYERCEMCGNEKIRYVHIMHHPNCVSMI